jgi:hypothetical protein
MLGVADGVETGTVFRFVALMMAALLLYPLTDIAVGRELGMMLAGISWLLVMGWVVSGLCQRSSTCCWLSHHYQLWEGGNHFP